MEFITSKTTPADHPILDHIKNRWSPRVFKSDLITETHIHQLLEAARWAASSYNQQPWRFIYAHRETAAHRKISDTLMPGNQPWAPSAPLLMLTAVKKDFDNGRANFHAIHDLGLAVGNLSIQAQALGIGLHQMAGLDRGKAAVAFDIPEEFEVITALAAGYYGGDIGQLPENLQAAEQRERSRLPLQVISAEGAWPAS